MMLKTTSCLTALAIGASACASSKAPPPNGGQAAMTMNAPLPPPSSTTMPRLSDPNLSPFDLLEIRVFNVEELSGEFRVDENGRLKLPLVGLLEVEGLSTGEVATHIENALTSSFLQEADVTVRVKESVNFQLTVEGAVEDPGIYDMPGQLTLLQAIAMSGGMTDLANPKKVVIIRTINRERQAAAFDVSMIRRGEIVDPAVYGNDMVIVDGDDLKRGYRDLMTSVSFLRFLTITAGAPPTDEAVATGGARQTVRD